MNGIAKQKQTSSLCYFLDFGTRISFSCQIDFSLIKLISHKINIKQYAGHYDEKEMPLHDGIEFKQGIRTVINPFTAKFSQTQILTKFWNFEKQIAPCVS